MFTLIVLGSNRRCRSPVYCMGYSYKAVLCVLIEFKKRFDVIIAKGEAYPQALLNDIIHNASLSSSGGGGGTVTKNLR